MLIDGKEVLTAEEKRLKEDREKTKYWKVRVTIFHYLSQILIQIALGTLCC
jgi:hypothetical protein